MNSIKKIIFWEPNLSPHKIDFFAAIMKLNPELDVICCSQQGLQQDRISLGWSVDNDQPFKVLISPSRSQIQRLVSSEKKSTLHIFSGIRWVPIINIALRYVKLNHANFAIMSEPRVSSGILGVLRFIHSWFAEGWIRRQVAFVLAQGRNGPPWFALVGYRKINIFPFAYFINPPITPDLFLNAKSSGRRAIKIVFIGRLIKMKGIFDLTQAIKPIAKMVDLTFLGTGPDEVSLRDSCLNLGLQVNFLGSIPMKDVPKFLVTQDILVLPSISTNDGWGMVVSEALMMGVAVICTPCVGASIIFSNNIFGRCVKARSPNLLTKAIIDLKASNAFSNEMRRKRSRLAKRILSAESGAKYFFKIIKWRFFGKSKPEHYFIK
jgi:glycosyltransferase involved in cell wall biosynthesis